MAPKTKSDLIERVRSALRDVPDVIEKRMFGSIGFMVRGKLAIGARSGRILCRIDPKLRAELLRLSGCRVVVMRDREMKGYVYVDESVLRNAKALKFWINLVLAYNGSISE